MKPPIKKVNFGDVVEIVDAKSGQFREKLASKAGMLAETMIDDAMDADDIRVRATALNAYSKYRYIEANDSSVLLDKIVNMSEKQINMLERALKQKSILEGVQTGKFGLEDIYNMPKKRNKK